MSFRWLDALEKEEQLEDYSGHTVKSGSQQIQLIIGERRMKKDNMLSKI